MPRELVSSILNIRARLEDYLKLVGTSTAAGHDRPLPRSKQLQPGREPTLTESDYEGVGEDHYE